MLALVLACRTGGDGSSIVPGDANAVPAGAGTTGADAMPLTRTQDAAPAIAIGDSERHAQIGEPAPDFELMDLWGRKHRLSAHRGKIVVLEWFNPVCPAVVYAYGEGEMREMKSLQASNGIVWLAINSTAPGEEGSDPKQNREFASARGLRMPILLDPTGAVGRAYGARVTPHMFVINERGLLVYQGALDNAPKGRVESLALKTNYVDMAIADLRSGHAVLKDSTRPYGCEIKYTRP
jgi:peroxiredoxin